MKKSILFLATAAIFAACTNDSVRENIAEDQVEIGFSTYIQKPVASKADNSNAETLKDLEAYHQNFVVNGFKTVATTETRVFANQLVTYADSKWGYSPVSYWDKSASKYSFYAAAPQTAAWTFANDETKGMYYTISGFTLTGNSLALTANDDFSASASFSGVDTDLMIATDIDNHTDFTETAVNFTFNHILSRLNISIAKASDLSAATVTLQSLTINKMKNVGDFDESKVSGTNLSNGTVGRWTASGSATISNASDATDLPVTEDKQWIYQGLVIPQTVEAEAINLDGTKSEGEVAKPYLTINYSISTTSGTVTNTQDYSYNYNLADLFNGDGTNNIDFCEGWQNNLNITIGAGIPIKFDAKVYDWATKVDGSYQVKP